MTTASKGGEFVPLPPRRTVRVLGRDIPVSDHFTVGETIELERVLLDPPASAVEQNVACLAVLIRHRLGEPVDLHALMREPLDDLAAFEAAVNELLAPFTQALLAAVIARRTRLTRTLEKAAATLSTGA